MNHKETKTQRLYYTDSYATTFVAAVADAGEWNGRPALALDRTLFYPTSGGQLHDTGLLAGQTVVDVIVEDDIVLHLQRRACC